MPNSADDFKKAYNNALNDFSQMRWRGAQGNLRPYVTGNTSQYKLHKDFWFAAALYIACEESHASLNMRQKTIADLLGAEKDSNGKIIKLNVDRQRIEAELSRLSKHPTTP